MDQTYLIIGVVALVVIGIAVFVLRRSWGSSLDRMPSQQWQAGSLPDHPIANVSDHTIREVQSLVARGNKIQAIKLLRDLTGMGLKEAKDYVESLPPGAAALDAPPPVPLAGQQAVSEQELAEVRALVAQGNKIQAIKRYREMTGLGLKEAKDVVEDLPPGGAFDLPLPAEPAPYRAVSEQELAEVRALAAQGNKIQAIKRYRELSGLGLKEAKDYVDTL